uniref:Tc1-like transposase DDE domain-containing protein n=1 Tax=Lepeophtheirus salmonis TaxID=72036 RepID=A0A0K2TJ82_LEPSM
MDKKENGGSYLFQQDSAPAHKVRKVQAWVNDNVQVFLYLLTWPSNSPDLNLLEFNV